MSFALGSLIIGGLLMIMALTGTLVRRLPLSTAMLYLVVGAGLGPAGWALLAPDPLRHSALLEGIIELALLISLFAAGLKLGLPLKNKHWRMPLRLALVSMTVTVGLIAVFAVYALEMSVGAAILLGGILAPTDPVLAADVQVESADDRDRLRFSLTGESALNDGAAYPFIMLGLGLLGFHDLGGGWRWFALDVVWEFAAGLLIGAALGALIGKLVVYMRARHQEAVGLDEFLALGLVGLAYGLAGLAHASGFLAVFAAGLALQRVREQRAADGGPTANSQGLKEGDASHPAHASAYMMRGVRGFNEQLERISEMVVVLLVGAMLAFTQITGAAIGLVLFLFIVARPASVWLGLIGSPVSREQRLLMSWFGIRGIGSIFYLLYAINHGLPRALAEQVLALTLTAVATSVVLHGISVTPLMKMYVRRSKRRTGT